MTTYHIPVLEFVLAAADAVDLISPAVGGHHKRVAYLAKQLAREIGTPPEDVYHLVVAAAVHDIGAFSARERLDTLEFELSQPQVHAELGYRFLHRFTPLRRVADIVRFHHLPWSDGQGSLHRGCTVPTASHLLHLADRIDVLTLKFDDPLAHIDEIRELIEAGRGRVFMPDAVEAMVTIARREFVWLDLRSPNLDRILKESLTDSALTLDDEGVLDLARLLAHLVDFRSAYTSTHTAGVAATAHFLAGRLGMSAGHCNRVRIAGYLHDLGKLAIEREILDKPSSLAADEYDKLKVHPYFTRRILEIVDEFSDIALWASAHHERPDGTGYPFHETVLDLETRIISVADIFTALAEERPYRAAMPPPECRKTMIKMAREEILDRDLVELVLADQKEVDAVRRKAQQRAVIEYREMMAGVA